MNSLEPKTEDAVIHFFESRGYEWKRLVEDARNWRYPVPEVENCLGPIASVTTGGAGEWSIVDGETNDALATVKDNGVLVHSVYLARFQSACRLRDLAVASSSFDFMADSISAGMSSIEGFFLHIARLWNSANPHDFLEDTATNPTNLDSKFHDWIPRVCGRPLNCSGINWVDFSALREIRHNYGIHPKVTAHAITFLELADLINRFRNGIAGVMFDLHFHLRFPIPASIINARFMPDAEVG